MNVRTHGWKTAGRAPASALLALLLLALAGCGADRTQQASSESSSNREMTQSAGDPPARDALAAQVGTSARRTAAAASSAGPIHHITLSDKRCIEFEPQWTSVRVGQSITWRSDLKGPITIYVSPGVFERASFTVKPGRTVNTGPALAAGRYSFWTEPSACREAPRGVLLAGPGVTVNETYYASK